MPGITPFRPVGIGADQQAYNVFKITFDQALSDIPILTAYDDYTIASNSNTLFAGTTPSTPPDGTPLPLIAAVSGKQGTTAYPGFLGSPSGWFPSTAQGPNAPVGTPNFLQGASNNIYLDTTAPGPGHDSVTFNLAYKFFKNLSTFSTVDGVIICQYQYTGSAPAVTFYGNSNTEVSPSWTPLVPYATGIAPVSGDTTQIRPCDTGKGADGDSTYRQTIPSTGGVFPQEIWAKNY